MSLARRLHILGCFLGVPFDEPAFGAALEHGFGNASKNGEDKKEFKNPQQQHFYR